MEWYHIAVVGLAAATMAVEHSKTAVGETETLDQLFEKPQMGSSAVDGGSDYMLTPRGSRSTVPDTGPYTAGREYSL